jgi:hypothetical protein
MLTFLAGMAVGVLAMMLAVAYVTRAPKRNPKPFECTCPQCRPDLQH